MMFLFNNSNETLSGNHNFWYKIKITKYFLIFKAYKDFH